MNRPDLFIERILLKESSPANEAERARAAALEEENLEILSRYPASAMRDAVKARLDGGSAAGKETRTLRFPPVTRSRLFAAVPLAAAACLAIVGAFAYFASPERFSASLGGALPLSGDSYEVRVKGGPALHVYRKTADGAELLSSGEAARENDVLQLRYSAGGDAWGAILSVDGNGTVTQHFPDSGNASGKLETGGEIDLAFSYRLDDAPKFERFIFVTGTREFSLADLKHDLSNLARIHRTGSFALEPLLPGGTRETDVLLRK